MESEAPDRGKRSGAGDDAMGAELCELQHHVTTPSQAPEEEAAACFRAAYGDDAPGWLPIFTAWTDSRGAKRTATWWHSATDLEGAARTAIRESARGRNVYMPVGLQRQRLDQYHRGDAASVCALVGMWADIDIAGTGHAGIDYPPTEADALALVAELPLEPTVLVHSGHGLQAWWCFREPWTLDNDEERQAAATLARRWLATVQAYAARNGWKIDATADLARVLRVPGTTNWKVAGAPAPVRLLGVLA